MKVLELDRLMYDDGLISSFPLKDTSNHYRLLNPFDRIVFIIEELIVNSENITILEKISSHCRFRSLDIDNVIFDDKGDFVAYKNDIIKTPEQNNYMSIACDIDTLLHDYNEKTAKKLEIAFSVFYKNIAFKDFIDNGLSIVNDNMLFPISIFLFDFSYWKKIITYELEIIKTKTERELTLNKFKNLVEDLKFRLGAESFPLINIDYRFGLDLKPIIVPAFVAKGESFSDYLTFLDNVDLTNISKKSKHRLLEIIQKNQASFKKIKLNPNFSYSNLLECFKKSSFENIESIRKEHFIADFIDIDFKTGRFNPVELSRNDFDNFILLMKYLQSKKILISSIRNLALCIDLHFKKFIGEEQIRNILSSKNQSKLSKKSRDKIDYYFNSVIIQKAKAN